MAVSHLTDVSLPPVSSHYSFDITTRQINFLKDLLSSKPFIFTYLARGQSWPQRRGWSFTMAAVQSDGSWGQAWAKQPLPSLQLLCCGSGLSPACPAIPESCIIFCSLKRLPFSSAVGQWWSCSLKADEGMSWSFRQLRVLLSQEELLCEAETWARAGAGTGDGHGAGASSLLWAVRALGCPHLPGGSERFYLKHTVSIFYKSSVYWRHFLFLFCHILCLCQGGEKPCLGRMRSLRKILAFLIHDKGILNN